MIHMDPSTNPPIVNPNINIVGTQYESNPDAAYGDHIKNTAAICNTSASHTYGNVMSVVEKYICDLFKNSSVNFRTVIASTTLASRQVTHLPNQLHRQCKRLLQPWKQPSLPAGIHHWRQLDDLCFLLQRLRPPCKHVSWRPAHQDHVPDLVEKP